MGVESAVIPRLILTALLVSGLAMPAFGQGSDTRVLLPSARAISISAPQAGGQDPQPEMDPSDPMPGPVVQTPAPAPADPQQAADTMPLSIDDAVQLALENNLNLEVVRINPLLADLNIATARSNWTPRFISNWSYQDAQQPSSSFFEGVEVTATQQFTGNFGFEQLLPWGTQYSVGFRNNRNESNNPFNDVNPRTNVNLELNFAQPLLQGFRIDGARQSLIVSRMNREITDVQLRDSIISTTRAVRNAYWDYVSARGNLDVARETLAVSEQQLRDNQKRVEVGTMAPIDVIEAEAEVAQNQSNVIAAETQVQEAEDQLRSLLFDPSSPEYWSTHFEPTDQPMVRLGEVDIDAAIQNALANRTDLRQARTQLQINDVNIRYAKNTTMPDLTLNVAYSTVGLGGTQLLRGEPDPGDILGPIIGEENRGYNDVLGDVFGLDFPTWSVGLNFSYPLGRSSQDVSLARARLQQRQAHIEIRDLERNIRQQIRTLGRQVNTNARLVESTRVARELAEKNLDAAQKRFAVGLINQFEVIQRQRDLADARFRELDAMISYAKSVVDFDAAQEGAILGAGGVTGASPGSTGGGGGSTFGGTTSGSGGGSGIPGVR